MPQFSVIPERAKILERVPDYEVRSKALNKTIRILYGDTVIAMSNDSLLVSETRHDDVVYLPREALKMEFFSATDHSTYCPFKGHANYWSLSLDGKIEDNIVWSYESPYPEVAQLKDYVSFYTNRTTMELA
jgi:uncharacterized protein (DUF427 family)